VPKEAALLHSAQTQGMLLHGARKVAKPCTCQQKQQQCPVVRKYLPDSECRHRLGASRNVPCATVELNAPPGNDAYANEVEPALSEINR
jgi:hypothetical protein